MAHVTKSATTASTADVTLHVLRSRSGCFAVCAWLVTEGGDSIFIFFVLDGVRLGKETEMPEC